MQAHFFAVFWIAMVLVNERIEVEMFSRKSTQVRRLDELLATNFSQAKP